MRKLEFIYLALLLFVGSLQLLGDGFAVGPGYGKMGWRLIDEDRQVAFISYDDGQERMFVRFLTQKGEKDIYWILPVPALPEQVDFDVPRLELSISGKDISDTFNDRWESVKNIAVGSQLYTIPFLVLKFRPYVEGFYLEEAGPPAPSMGMAGPPGVTVHKHIEEEGVVAEKITAKDGESLFNYLKSKGLGITKGAIPVLDYYIGKDFTFIVAWLSKTITFQERFPRGLYLRFPTKEIYYPLYPTSIYGEKRIPITLYISSFCTPKPNPNIKDWTIGYWLGSISPQLPTIQTLQPGPVGDFARTLRGKDRLTIININAPAKSFTSDLWISPRTPPKVLYAYQATKNIYTIGFLLFLLASLLSGYLIGRIVFAKLRKEPLILLALGFVNLFSLIGLIFSLFFLKLKSSDVDVSATLEELRKKGYQKRRLSAFFLFWLSALLFTLTFFYPESPLYLFLLILALLCLLSAFLLQRVKREDEPLFTQLIEAGYSPYFLFPAERSRLAFLPLFSITFLLLLYLLLALVKLPFSI